jgi:hypothetical protein
MRSGLSRRVDWRCGHCEVEVSCSEASDSKWPLLVKSRQIARVRALKKLLRGSAGKEVEVAHHVRLIAVTGFEGYLRKCVSGIPQPADML